MTFRVTTANNATESELPGNRTIWVRIVGAEVSRLDSGGKVPAERGDDLSDSDDSLFYPLGDGRTRPFGFRRRAPVPAAESDRGGELVGNRL